MPPPTNLEKAVSEQEASIDTLAFLEAELAALQDADSVATEAEVDNLVQLAKDIQAAVMNHHRKIQALAPANPSDQQQSYFTLMQRSTKLVGGLTGKKMQFSSNSSSPHSVTASSTDIRLPKLELPT